MIDLFKYFKYIKEKDPAMKSIIQILFFNDGFWAIIWYRIAHWFYIHHMKFIGLYIMHKVKLKRGIEIHPACIIGKNLLIDHGVGVVIGETTIIGDNCIIYQGVTLGGTGKEKGKRHPTIGNNVLIGSGAKVLGNIYIGDNVKIGSNATVLDNIESLNTVVGCKGKVISK